MIKTVVKIPLLITLLVSALLAQSCMQEVSSNRAKTFAGSKDSNTGDGTGIGGDTAVSDDDSLDDSGTEEILKVDITNIFDPFSGTLKSKATIPKDYNKPLYITGLNITAIKDKSELFVRFRFGRELTTIDVPAVVGMTTGITPQAEIDVITLNMANSPFKDLRLNYDLFDYNDYSSGHGLEDDELYVEPWNNNLYCRGLLIEHDPTFSGNSASNPVCNEAGEKCYYAYAKIEDQTFATDQVVDGQNAIVTSRPTKRQINVLPTASYANDLHSNAVQKCLPDTNAYAQYNLLLGTNFTSDLAMTDVFNPPAVVWKTDYSSTSNYYYSSPYNTVGVLTEPTTKAEFSDWEISGDAVFGSTGVFSDSMLVVNSEKRINGGFGAFLYPRFARQKMNQGVQYAGSDDAFDLKSILSVTSTGRSKFMYGCNERVATYNESTLESVSSCNVAATISLVVKDSSGTVTEVLTETSTLKLQIIRESDEDFYGNETVYTSLRSCDSNRTCGKDECCFNNKCWSKDIVSQCYDTDDRVGDQLPTDSQCSSDLQCASLCCNKSTGKCADHIIQEGRDPVYCGKSIGQSCLTREYCAQVEVTVYKNIRFGPGADECKLMPFIKKVFADCDGSCRQPEAPTVPTIDPDNPCEGAIEGPPTDL
ncbi:hypothetical protein HBN50_03830 [Halobacteriovorax sp. GB3]|uniref:hypothetical protein n=1 Tax=Halobacteriovorax sp. GB3 TaxID=2719615 RepID=UPI0023619A2C|nr:hypothetical protein [Halobacteriovorax sp. GB3]MDD0852209.1 hypothetical protein [Halobacteriovorax sp. GB3]